MTNKKHGTLYIGMTNNLLRRVIEHKQKSKKSFSKKYNLDKLVWYEQATSSIEAIQKEKQMKKWYRKYKENVIEKLNPEWKDLFYEIGGSDDLLSMKIVYGD